VNYVDRSKERRKVLPKRVNPRLPMIANHYRSGDQSSGDGGDEA
jgi:hypothetical protein